MLAACGRRRGASLVLAGLPRAEAAAGQLLGDAQWSGASDSRTTCSGWPSSSSGYSAPAAATAAVPTARAAWGAHWQCSHTFTSAASVRLCSVQPEGGAGRKDEQPPSSQAAASSSGGGGGGTSSSGPATRHRHLAGPAATLLAAICAADAAREAHRHMAAGLALLLVHRVGGATWHAARPAPAGAVRGGGGAAARRRLHNKRPVGQGTG